VLIEALLLGLSTGSFCVMACAPYALPLLFAEAADTRGNARLLGLFVGGRLMGYLVSGCALGLSGALFLRYVPPRFERGLSLFGYMLAGGFLLAQGLSYFKPKREACLAGAAADAKGVTRGPMRNAALLGLASGLSLCPPFVAAATRVFAIASSRSPLAGLGLGAAYFALFFVGTSVYLLPLLGIPLISRKLEPLRQVARMATILLGAYFLVFLGLLGFVG
jgi:hypothetical protein